MIVTDFILGVRKSLQDTKKTRFTDGTILDSINEAYTNIARDTWYFKATLLFKIYPYIQNYTLDRRIIKVVKATYNTCSISIQSWHDKCELESENSLQYLYVSKHETRGIAIYPILTKPETTYVINDGGLGLAVDDYEIVPAEDGGGGIPIYVDDEEDAVVGVEQLDSNYGSIYLQAVVYPEELSYASELELELEELVKYYVVYSLLLDSSIGSITSRASKFEQKYKELAKKLKTMQSSAYAITARNVKYRTPFQTTSTQSDDF